MMEGVVVGVSMKESSCAIGARIFVMKSTTSCLFVVGLIPNRAGIPVGSAPSSPENIFWDVDSDIG